MTARKLATADATAFHARAKTLADQLLAPDPLTADARAEAHVRMHGGKRCSKHCSWCARVLGPVVSKRRARRGGR